MTFRVLVCSVLLAGAAGRGLPAAEAAPPRTVWYGAPPAGQQRFVIVPGESQVVYRVGETLIRDGNRFNLAVGVTTTVRGEITIDRTDPRASRIGPIAVDISQFRSDSQRRDTAIRERWLESARFPIAEFAPTRIDGLPAQHEEGRELTLRITGNLKIRNVVKPTTFVTTLRLSGGELSGTATGRILMTDFGFDPPAIFGILRAQNEVEIEFRFLARP